MIKKNLIGLSEIKEMILELRGRKVVLDRYLAELYEISTGNLMQAVKRNKKRFPDDFMFQLSNEETEFLVSQSVIPFRTSFGGRNPYVFTRNGANMLSAILRSSVAIDRSIQIMRAFSSMEEMMGKSKKSLTTSPDIIERLSTQSKAIMHLFQKDKLKTREISKIKSVLKEMITMMQNIVLGM